MPTMMENSQNAPMVFRYKGRAVAFALICFFAFGFLAVTLFAITRGIGFGLGMLMTLLSLFLFAVSGVAIIGQSDIAIDKEGISRRLFGKTWRTIGWDSVKIIKAFHVPELGFRSKNIRAFAIYPTTKPIDMAYLPHHIGFTEKYSNIDQLLGVINHHASKHQIEIECQNNGVRTRVAHL
jgi:hypothetical protein